MLLGWLIACTIVYVIIGIIVANSSAFDRKQTNPVQDFIHWMSLLSKSLLWPFLILAWLVSDALSSRHWPGYVSHQERMELMVDEIVRNIDRTNPSAGVIDYDLPSPRMFREYGMAAINMIVYEA